MEDNATISETGTALSNDDAVERIAATLDMPEASETSEQAEDHVETEPTTDENEVVETPEEQYFDFDGEQISLTDLRNGYLRQNDYTRKTQEIAEQRRVYQENQRDINQLRGDALAGIEALKAHVAAEFRVMEMPDFDYLAEHDPAEFLRQQHIWTKRQNAVQQVYQAEQAIKAKQAEYEAEQHQAQIRETKARFLEKYPEYQDNAKADAVQLEITNFLLDTGFTPDEIRGISDFRIIDLLVQVVQGQKLKNSVQPVVEKISQKPVLSQKNQSAKASDSYSRDFEKFNKSRSANDAIALISQLL